MDRIKRWVFVGYFSLSLWAAWIVANAVKASMGLARMNDQPIVGSQLTISVAIGIVVAAIAGFVAFKNPVSYNYASEIVVELGKVTWPTREELREHTKVVIATVFLAAGILGFFDFLCSTFTGLIY